MKNVDSHNYLKVSLPEKQFLANRLSYSLDFAIRTIQHLIVDGHAATEDSPWFVRSEKIIAEASFLMVFAKAGKMYVEVEQTIDILFGLLEPLARSKSTMTNICLKPALALDYAHGHICLNYLGYSNEFFDNVVDKALKDDKRIERTPYRVLEQEWLLKIWKNKNNNKEFKFWSKLCCMNFSLDLFSESTDGVYSLTHAIMYSFFDESLTVDVDLDKLINAIEGLLIIYMDKQDYDIAGELLMAWTLTKKPLNHIALFALKCLTEIEKRVGFLPAPNLDLTMIEGKDIKERRTYIYSINYHTVFVMGLLSGSLLKNYDTIQIQPNQQIKSSELNIFLKNELQKEKQAHWMEYFKILDNEQKNVLLPWVFQAILVRKIKQHKYGLVKKMIDLAIDNIYLKELLMIKQAKELLIRLKQIS